MKKALVLGCGLIGKTVALDLSKDFEVTVMDPFAESLATLGDNHNIKKVQKSASDPASLSEFAKDADVVCGLLPSQLEGTAQEQMLREGKKYVSPSGFFHREGMDEIAKKYNAVGVYDMGVAPGMSNFLLGKGASMLEELDFGCIYVGGIPDKLDPPFNYRTVFCLEDTMTEYIWPARYVENNKIVEVPALTGMEDIEIEGIGKLEAFFTDGLRSAADNVKGKYVAEKTLRWPGYVEKINILKAAGCFNKETVTVDGKEVSPFEVTTETLRPLWKLRPEKGDRDLTVMKVITRGPKDGKVVTYTWQLIDKFDDKEMLHSMARTTGYPCAVTARALANGIISAPGFHAPEMLAKNQEFYDYLMPELAKRNVVYKMSTLIEEK